MPRRQGESRRHDALGGYHPKPGGVVAAKMACCGTPVFAPIEAGRMMMRAGQKRDAMVLWRNLRSLELVGCSEGPWGREGGKRTWKERMEVE